MTDNRINSLLDSWIDKNRNEIIQTREKVAASLFMMGFDVIPSKANFIFASSDKIPASELAAELRAKGILVRYFNKAKIDNYLRITVGSAEDMQTLVDCIREITEAKK